MPCKLKKLYIRTHNQHLSEAIQKMAFERGYGWPITGFKVETEQYPYLVLNSELKTILHASSVPPTGEVYSSILHLTEIIKWLEENDVQKLLINDTDVKVARQGDITYGCTTIKFEDVKRIFDCWSAK